MYCLSLFIFCLLCLPFVSDPIHRYTVLGVYAFVFVIGFSSLVVVETTNPIHRRARDKIEKPEEGPCPVRYCKTCCIYQEPETKHCNLCCKCIDVFDHHCLYLNTCIAKSNYHSFFTLVSSLCFLLLIQLYLTIYQIVNYQNVDYSILNLGHSTVYLSLLLVTGLVPLGALFAVGSLWLFHIFLSIKGITTYHWIVERRRRLEGLAPDPNKVMSQAEKEKKEKLERQKEVEREQWIKRMNEEKSKRGVSPYPSKVKQVQPRDVRLLNDNNQMNGNEENKSNTSSVEMVDRKIDGSRGGKTYSNPNSRPDHHP